MREQRMALPDTLVLKFEQPSKELLSERDDFLESLAVLQEPLKIVSARQLLLGSQEALDQWEGEMIQGSASKPLKKHIAQDSSKGETVYHSYFFEKNRRRAWSLLAQKRERFLSLRVEKKRHIKKHSSFKLERFF